MRVGEDAFRALQGGAGLEVGVVGVFREDVGWDVSGGVAIRQMVFLWARVVAWWRIVGRPTAWWRVGRAAVRRAQEGGVGRVSGLDPLALGSATVLGAHAGTPASDAGLLVACAGALVLGVKRGSEVGELELSGEVGRRPDVRPLEDACWPVLVGHEPQGGPCVLQPGVAGPRG